MRTVAFLAFDGLQLLDLAGPLEVLHAATALGATPPYDRIVVTPDGAPVRSESGLEIGADTSLVELRSRVGAGDLAVDTFAVVGGLGTRRLAEDRAVLDDVAAIAGAVPRTASVCTGALVLAASGMLDGYSATTHWAFCEKLAERYPEIQVEPDQIYVHDRDRWTSAGVTAGVDLFLALVDRDHGAELAHAVARWLVVFVRRPGGQAQFSVQLSAEPARSHQIDQVQRWLPDHLDRDLGVEQLARRAGMSPRSFARAFKAETGTTPAVYVEKLRVEAAQRLLEASDRTVEAVARAVGFTRPETFYRAFARQVGTSPDRYRQHFADRPRNPSGAEGRHRQPQGA